MWAGGTRTFASYDLSDLVPDGPEAAGKVEAIIREIQSGVSPEAWKAVPNTMLAHGRMLLVFTASPGLQSGVADFLLRRYAAQMPAGHKQLHDRLAVKWPVDFAALPLEKALEAFSISSGVEVTLAEDARASAAMPVTVQFRKASAGLVLRWLARTAGLAWRFRGGAVVLEQPVELGPVVLHRAAAERRVAGEVAALTADIKAASAMELGKADFTNMRLGECLDWFREKMGVDIICDVACEPQLAKFRVSLQRKGFPGDQELTEDLPAGQVLELVVKAAGLRVGLRDGAILVLANRVGEPGSGMRFRPAADAGEPVGSVRFMLAQKLVTFKWVDTPATEALAFLARETGVRMVVDDPAKEAVQRTINLKLKDVPAGVALEFLLRRCHLNAKIINGTLHIGNAE